MHLPRESGAAVGAQSQDPLWQWWAVHAPRKAEAVVGSLLQDPWQWSAPASGVQDGSGGLYLPLQLMYVVPCHLRVCVEKEAPMAGPPLSLHDPQQ